MSQEITIKTIEAPPFNDLSATLTPRLILVVEYTTGGTSFLSGNSYPRGYEISIRHDRLSDKGFRSLIIDGKGNPTACIEGAKRFSSKTLEGFWADPFKPNIQPGKRTRLVNFRKDYEAVRQLVALRADCLAEGAVA